MSHILLITLRLFLSYTFIKARLSKIAYPLVFAYAVKSYEVCPEQLLTCVALILPWAEAVTGICLLLGLLTQGASLLAVLLSSCFVILVSSALWKGLDISCGCFTGDISQINGTHIAFNLLLLFFSFILFWKGPGRWSLDALRNSSDKTSSTPSESESRTTKNGHQETG